MTTMSVTSSFRRAISLSKTLRSFIPASKFPSDRLYTTTAQKESDSTVEKSPTEESTLSGQSEEVIALKKAVEGQKAEIVDLQDKYKRSLAETQNVRNRMQRQIEDAKHFGIQSFCKDLLEVADILQLATGSGASKPDGSLTPSQQAEYLDSMRKGLEMTQVQLLKVFERHGLTKIDPEGQKFDPNCHEAVFEVPDGNKTPGTVAVVTKIGYQLNQRVIRPAAVGVVKKP